MDGGTTVKPVGRLSSLWHACLGDMSAKEARHEQWGTFLVVYAWFLGLQFLDLISTTSVLILGGSEGNAFAADAVEGSGLDALLQMKIMLLGLTLLVWTPAIAWLLRAHDPQPRAALAVNGMLTLLAIFYTAIIFWNLTNLATLVSMHAG